jgi:hypothetical protein
MLERFGKFLFLLAQIHSKAKKRKGYYATNKKGFEISAKKELK